MTDRKIHKIVHKRRKEIPPEERKSWQFQAGLYGFVGRQHLIKVGDCLWYSDHSRFSTPERVFYLYPVQVIQLGKGNEKVKVKFTDENGDDQQKWIWSSSLRSEDR